MEVIYLDYNASTPVDKEVADFMLPFLQKNFGNPSSMHWYGIQTRNAIEEARKKLADLINCEPFEIIFTSGGTESNNLAIKGVALSESVKGRHIITSSIEHPAVMEVCRYLEKKGFEVSYIGVDRHGIIDMHELEKTIRKDTILVSIMHANNETGSIQPITQIADLLQDKNIVFHTDAAQSVGKIKTDVSEMGADLLSVAGHKFYGPKGIGALYIRKGITLSKLMQGADHERNIRPGTENVLEIAGLGKAAEIAKRDLDTNSRKMMTMRDLLFHEINRQFPDVVRHGHPQTTLPNTLSISFPKVDAGTLLSELSEIAASSGAACHSDQIHVSHVLQAMKVPEEIAMGTIRLSTGKDTREDEVTKAAEMICAAAKKLAGSKDSGFSREINEKIDLTKYTHGLGCACKIAPGVLENILREFSIPDHPDILVGTDTSDDAAVYRINEDTAIVQTIDFFTPVIDDPFRFGAIAAANALSDVYAMGAKPLFALNIVAFPVHRLPMKVLNEIIRGAKEVTEEAGIHVLGGHTIEDNEPKFGMVVTGTVHPSKIWRNSTAKPGDDIIITKAIGTGILSTAMKKGFIDRNTAEELYQSMRELNRKAAEIIKDYPISACTDITGFGLLGHLREMSSGSKSRVYVNVNSVPFLSRTKEFAERSVIPGGTINNLSWLKDYIKGSCNDEIIIKMLCDAQTSGGLMFTISSDYSMEIIKHLTSKGVNKAAIIGKIDDNAEPGIIYLQ